MNVVVLFQDRFVSKIRDGSKPHTIRGIRKGRQIQSGDTLSLRHWFSKPYRSKQVVIREVECTCARDIQIERNDREYGCGIVTIEGNTLDQIGCDLLAKSDGFEWFSEMVAWFERTHSLPFVGRLIEWSVKQ